MLFLKGFPLMKKTTLFKTLFLGTVCLYLLTAVFTGCTKKGYSSGNSDVKTGTDKGTDSVTINQQNFPKRIVSLSPANTEILCAVGAINQIAARTDFCNYPPEVSSIPSTGGFSGDAISLETILSYNPDFIYATKAAHFQLLEPLKNSGVQIYLSEASTINDICNEIEYIGSVTGHEQTGRQKADEIRTLFEESKKRTEGKPKTTVYYEVWNQPLISIGKSVFMTEIMEANGGKNIFDDVTDEYPIVSEEMIIARNPEVIILPEENGFTKEDIINRAGWQNISAVKNDRIYIIPSDPVSRPGPRVKEASELFDRILNGK